MILALHISAQADIAYILPVYESKVFKLDSAVKATFLFLFR